ncbi:uncharacterized protein [Prorops nasuta]|uniref:uncharacterized protein n=1 Tax=Prorops nasuta TaxID=863751 RepID=UPI0034CE6D9F
MSMRGKLVDKYRNKLRQCKILAEESKTGVNISQTETPRTEENESLLWLQNNEAPWELVEMHWKKTSTFRLNQWQSKSEKQVFDIIRNYRVLQLPLGYMLIVDDFANWNLTTELLSFEKRNSFFNKLIKVCPLPIEKIAYVRILSGALTEVISDDSRIAIHLSLLSYMIPPKGRIRYEKSKHFKPSMSESEESIILHYKIPGDITRRREEKKASMKKIGLSIQPYIIIVDPRITAIHSIFL